MKIIIAGAGAVGGQAARALCYRGNDVTVIDTDETALASLREETDVMTFQGNAAYPSGLVDAGIRSADMVLAVTGSSEANLVVCTLAKTFGVRNKIARLRTREYFDSALEHGSETFGVDDFIIPEEACVQEIMDSLNRPAVKEMVPIGSKSCEVVNFQVPQSSPLVGSQLQRAPRPDLLERLRVCAIKRHGQLIVPRGDTEVLAYDEAYVAGNRSDVDEFIIWATPEARPIKRVVVTGATSVARRLAAAVQANGMTLSMVVDSEIEARDLVEELSAKTTLIHGESTDASVLEEAAVGDADAVVAAGANNEANILTCILAKRMGAGKVVSVVDNTDYSQIIANLEMIDCGFNPLVAAVDSLLQHIGSEVRQHVAMLKRIEAEVLDFVVNPKARIAGKRIADLDSPQDMVLIAIFRNGDFVPPVGRETLYAGDRLTVLVRSNRHDAVERFFASKRLF